MGGLAQDQSRPPEAGHRRQQHRHIEYNQHGQDDEQQLRAVDRVEELLHLLAEEQRHDLQQHRRDEDDECQELRRLLGRRCL